MEPSEPSTSTKDNSTNRSDDCMESTSGMSVDDFLSTGRTGRRNALPDILEHKSSHVNTADLPDQIQKLSFQDSTDHNGSSGSVGSVESVASTSTGNQNK